MRYVIVDLEATCWEHGPTARMEIIEIGAVILQTDRGPVDGEFARFVRPIEEPVLSDFCVDLTSIRQEDVDRAQTFGVVFPQFLEWIGPEPHRPCSWGAYDLRQLRLDCELHGIPLPASFAAHINLKKEFARWMGVRPCGMNEALAQIGLPLVGRHHRAIDDARNIAEVAQLYLPEREADGDS